MVVNGLNYLRKNLYTPVNLEMELSFIPTNRYRFFSEKSLDYKENNKKLFDYVKKGFTYFKNSRIGKFFYNSENDGSFSLYNPQIEGKVLKNLKKNSRKIFDYIKEHPIKSVAFVGATTLFVITSYCDLSVLNALAPATLNAKVYYLKKFFLEGKIPSDTSIFPLKLPPHYSHPVIGSNRPLTLLEKFSLYYPIAYLATLAGGVLYKYKKWKKSKEI